MTDWARHNVSGIVLNGGQSRRMGRDKSGLVIGGRPLIARVLDVLSALFDEILIVGRPLPSSLLTRHAARGTAPTPQANPPRSGGLRPSSTRHAARGTPPSSHAARGTRHIPDAIPSAGPLGGIYSGLLAMSCPFGFFVACDMPWLDPAVIRRQLDVLRATGADAVVPCWNESRVQVCTPYVEPLHAVYSQDCLPAARRQLESGDLRIRGFFDHVNVFFWDVRAEGISPRSFTNINTKSDLAALLGDEA